MSQWENFKEWTKHLALSKPLRWLVSGVTAFTFAGGLLSLLLELLPTSAGFISLDLLIVLSTSLLVARATSRGYTAIEEYIKKVDNQTLRLESLTKEVHTLEHKSEAQNRMIRQLVQDTTQQNDNNMNFYLQQVGILRYCETLAEQLPENEKNKLLGMLDPPSLNQIQGKRPPNMLASTVIQPEPDSDPDSADEMLERKISPPPQLVRTSPPQPTSLLSSIYQGAKGVYGSFSFWGTQPAANQELELSRSQNQAFLEGLPADAYDADLESPPDNNTGSSHLADPFYSPPGSPPDTTQQLRRGSL